ncbi:hypothetical protein BaRGS_00010105 [Batillaria attramentaria]|uniref:Uncharacterized protein n=1 Tax=Batillaria attramentaria TaxID=370345 RepID=A0ABD0LH42_9CAEN
MTHATLSLEHLPHSIPPMKRCVRQTVLVLACSLPHVFSWHFPIPPESAVMSPASTHKQILSTALRSKRFLGTSGRGEKLSPHSATVLCQTGPTSSCGDGHA